MKFIVLFEPQDPTPWGRSRTYKTKGFVCILGLELLLPVFLFKCITKTVMTAITLVKQTLRLLFLRHFGTLLRSKSVVHSVATHKERLYFFCLKFRDDTEDVKKSKWISPTFYSFCADILFISYFFGVPHLATKFFLFF